MWIKTILSLGYFCFFCSVFAQTPKNVVDFAGQPIEELVEKQNALTFNPDASGSNKVVLNYEEYGFELALPKRPKTINTMTEIVPKEESKENTKEKLLYQGKLDSIELVVQLVPSEKTLKAQLGSWLNTQQYKHKPFPILSYRKGMLGQCYALNHYKVALAQEFQQKIIIFSLTIAKPELAAHYERVQQILNGFNAFGSSNKKEDPKEDPKNTNPNPTVEIREEKIEEQWTPPSPDDIKTRLKNLPETGPEEQMVYLGYACPASIYFQIKVLGEASGISLREEEPGQIGNLTSLMVLIEACSAIAQKKLSEKTKISIQEQDRLVLSQIAQAEKTQELDIEFLLKSLVTQNDATALLLLETQVGWEAIRKQALNLGVVPEYNVFPIRFKQFIYADLVPNLQKKSFESKIENWNLYPANRKEKTIQEALESNKSLSYADLNKQYQAFLKKLSFEQKLLLAKTFGVKTNPKSLTQLLEKALKNELCDLETSELFLKYLAHNQSHLWFHPFPEGTIGGVLIGNDLGVTSVVGYAKLPKGKTLVFSFIADQLKEENASEKLKNNIYLIFYLASRFYNQ